jgi:NhaP-type Na+/H+ or K+/H+ antiporter
LAFWLFNLDWRLSALLAAVLAVSGPTVVAPLLRHIRPSPHTGSILRWEGILIDPIGAIFAVLVFKFALQSAAGGWGAALIGVFESTAIGVVTGLLVAWAIVQALKRYWIPDFLHTVVTLTGVIGAFLLANQVYPEAGLLAVTVMGVALANQHQVPVRHIIEFKENLRVLLIAGLFIILSARLDWDALLVFDRRGLIFLALLILVVRPLVVLVSTAGSQLTWREKIFLAAVYPRGIIAAAVASIFALRLAELGYAGGEDLAARTFMVIIGTVVIYGVLARPLARWLGIAKWQPQGALILGAGSVARAIAKTLKSQGYAVQLVDEHEHDVEAARREGLPVYYARTLEDFLSDEIELGDLGYLLALTPSDELNSLAAVHFADAFGRKDVFQLAVERFKRRGRRRHFLTHLGGRTLFGKQLTYEEIERRFAAGVEVVVEEVGEKLSLKSVTRRHGAKALPLCLINDAGKLLFFADHPPRPEVGQRILILKPTD